VSDEAAADVIRSDVVDRLMHAWQGRFTASTTQAGLPSIDTGHGRLTGVLLGSVPFKLSNY